ncbi:MAG: hypothetical protein HKP53_03600 [Eudoraea sp.]|nr:hypothetical protein [Eudoraea sp.]
MPKLLTRIFGIFLLFVLLAVGFIYFFKNEPLPQASPSIEADVLANKMLVALGHEAYKNTRYLEWSFRNGDHHYRWDKTMGYVDVRWDENEVHLNLNNTDKSEAVQEGISMDGDEKTDLVKKALSYFNNDSFWLVGPFKVFDEGTTRAIVTTEDGKKRLLVTYTQGGDTPGDSYLWLLDESGIPESFKMWVQILPLKGQEASWEGWHQQETGVLLPQLHRIGPLKLDMGTVKAYN